MAVTAAASQENSLEIGLENKLEKLCEERQILIRREKKLNDYFVDIQEKEIVDIDNANEKDKAEGKQQQRKQKQKQQKEQCDEEKQEKRRLFLSQKVFSLRRLLVAERRALHLPPLLEECEKFSTLSIDDSTVKNCYRNNENNNNNNNNKHNNNNHNNNSHNNNNNNINNNNTNTNTNNNNNNNQLRSTN